jgi:Uma2 family endonuclease
METYYHYLQMNLLLDALVDWLAQRQDGFAGGNMFVYFSLEQIRARHKRKFLGPDVFVVVDVPQRSRKSWVAWQEGKCPDVVIELLSETTAKQDKGSKKLVYQNELRVPEYFWFDPFNPDDWAGFVLQEGVYQPLAVDEQGRLPCQRLGLTLVRWHGVYWGLEMTWLRWAYPDGHLLLTEAEAARQLLEQERQRLEQERQRVAQEQQRAEQEQQRAEQEQQRAEQEQQRAERLAARLRELGIDPDAV